MSLYFSICLCLSLSQLWPGQMNSDQMSICEWGLTPPRIYAYACIQPINGEADCRSWMTLSSTSAACAPASHLVSRAGQDRSSFKEKEDLLRRVRTETRFKDCCGSLDSSSFTGSYFWSLLETHPVVDGQLQHHENQMQFRQEIFLTCNCRLCKISRR